MKNQFEEAMAKRTDSELEKILNSQPGDYQSGAIEAAEQEIKKRKLIRDKFSKYSNEQVIEILKSEKIFNHLMLRWRVKKLKEEICILK